MTDYLRSYTPPLNYAEKFKRNQIAFSRNNTGDDGKGGGGAILELTDYTLPEFKDENSSTSRNIFSPIRMTTKSIMPETIRVDPLQQKTLPDETVVSELTLNGMKSSFLPESLNTNL